VTENTDQSPETTPEETAAEAAPVAAPTPAPAPVGIPAEDEEAPLYYWGTGRRKTAVARVRLKPGGSGQVTINKRPLEVFFNRSQDRKQVFDALRHTNTMDQFDIFVNVRGGGQTGQAGAVRLGIARALIKHNAANLELLRESGYLTRDARVKERKKYGQRGARASFQFSKR